MRKGYKYRLYPEPYQLDFLEKNLRATRFVWNWALEKQIKRKEANMSIIPIQAEIQPLLTLKKCVPDTAWIGEAIASSLIQSLRNLDAEFTKYFLRMKKGTIQKLKDRYIAKCNENGILINWKKLSMIGHPKYKSRNDPKQSFQIHQGYKIEDNTLKLPKLDTWLTFNKHRDYQGTEKTITITKDNLGHWYLSIIVETNEECQPAIPLEQVSKDKIVGIDLGIKNLITTSEGEVFDNPNFLRSDLEELKRIQAKRKLRTKKTSKRLPIKKGSRKYKELKKREAKLHKHIAQKRKDYLHKITSQLVKEYDVICIEDLNIDGMKQNHCLALSITDVGWSYFRTMLEYKCKWAGKHLVIVDRWAATSQICSTCGFQNTALRDLSIREWRCPVCGAYRDRDINAAKNVRRMGMMKLGLPEAWGVEETPTIMNGGICEAESCEPQNILSMRL